MTTTEGVATVGFTLAGLILVWTSILLGPSEGWTPVYAMMGAVLSMLIAVIILLRACNREK